MASKFSKYFTSSLEGIQETTLIEYLKGIKKKHKLFSGTGATEKQIEDAEKRLSVIFSDEYKSYLLEYGIVSYNAVELTGLNKKSHMDVVSATLEERKLNKNFPKDAYLIQNLGIDAVLLLGDNNDRVYLWKMGKTLTAYPSLVSYLMSIEDDE